jgi:hypothetical protein
MHGRERCDTILRLIDETLAEYCSSANLRRHHPRVEVKSKRTTTFVDDPTHRREQRRELFDGQHSVIAVGRELVEPLHG